MAHGKMYLKIFNKQKKYTNKLHSEIRNLKTTNPWEFWRIIKTESNYKSIELSSTSFTKCLNHFCEINSDNLVNGIDLPLFQVSVNSQNEAINMSFPRRNYIVKKDTKAQQIKRR